MPAPSGRPEPARSALDVPALRRDRGPVGSCHRRRWWPAETVLHPRAPVCSLPMCHPMLRRARVWLVTERAGFTAEGPGHYSAAPQHSTPRRDMSTSAAVTTMTCSRCQLSGGPFTVDEAALHVATHNRFHHAGTPIAFASNSAGGPANAEAA